MLRHRGTYVQSFRSEGLKVTEELKSKENCCKKNKKKNKNKDSTVSINIIKIPIESESLMKVNKYYTDPL